MKDTGNAKQPEHGGAPEKGGSFKRGPRPQPRTEPSRDPERDRYGSPGHERDAAGRERRSEDRDLDAKRDEYSDFLRDREAAAERGDDDTKRG